MCNKSYSMRFSCFSLYFCIRLYRVLNFYLYEAGCEMFALNPFVTLPNRGPAPSLNHNDTLSDMPTYHLLSLLIV